ncbi:MAG: hypothetical protein IH983_11370 [Planctomycetes bacterium]|nr:hypothetical protein [Planctomycetota bacterium]
MRPAAIHTVTYDFHRLMDGATLLQCCEFADAIIETSSEPAVMVVELS